MEEEGESAPHPPTRLNEGEKIILFFGRKTGASRFK